MKPVSSVYGEIRQMLLTFPGFEVYPNDIVLQRYQRIFESLGNNIKYFILADTRVHDSIRQTAFTSALDPDANLKLIAAFDQYPSRVTKIRRHIDENIYECELEIGHTIWAQDGYCILKRDNEPPALLEPLQYYRAVDDLVADQVAANTDMKLEVTKYPIQGGNILAGDDYILVGKDCLYESADSTGDSVTEIINGFKTLFGVNHVIWLGLDEPVNFPFNVYQGVYQPIFHIDMYITLAGKANNGKELVYVADVNLAKQILRHTPPPAAIAEAFDRTAEYLATFSEDGLEFEVRRLPIDLWDVPNGEGRFLTYNNCLIEWFKNGEQKNVYLPAYSSVAPGSRNRRRLDEKVTQRFADDGFTVKLLRGAYEELCKRGGSIHCITKTLDRRL